MIYNCKFGPTHPGHPAHSIHRVHHNSHKTYTEVDSTANFPINEGETSNGEFCVFIIVIVIITFVIYIASKLKN